MEKRGQPLLQMAKIEKNFGATRALVEANIELFPGEVHTLLGENGSGKSTLVKILGGVHQPDSGKILLDGADLTLRSPRGASHYGIETVFQEVLTASHQSVLQNIWLGSDGIFRRRFKTATQRQQATEVLERLLGDAQLDVPAAELSLSARQAVSIARSLVRRPRVLILDEATAALDVQTRDRLFSEIRRLTAQGSAVLFISHRMDEVAEISDRVTVLRSGQTISTVAKETMTISGLIQDMTGSKVSPEESFKPPREPGKVVLQARDIQLAEQATKINVDIRAGEILGLCGLEGHGQDLFIRRLSGFAGGPGRVSRLEAEQNNSATPVGRRNAAGLGVAYLPRERRGESLFEQMSIQENFVLPTMRQDKIGPFLSRKRMAARFREYIQSLSIKLGSPDDSITTLSGGNQQKVLLARWLATEPSVLLLNDPTRGVDISTKLEIYRTLQDLALQGTAIVVLSSEVDEIVQLTDRALVFRDKTVFAELAGKDLHQQSIVTAYFGQEMEVQYE